MHEALEHDQQRNVGFGDRFEKPIFLEKIFVLGMAHERQVRVENESEAASHLVIPSEAAESRRITLMPSWRDPSIPLRSACNGNYSVRQKSWNRSRPFLMTSMLVA